MPFFIGYVGLLSGNSIATASEITASGYERVLICFQEPGSGHKILPQSSSLVFGVAADDWGLITGIALFAAGSATAAPDPIASWAIRPQAVTTGGTLTIGLDNITLLLTRSMGVVAPGDRLGYTAAGHAITAQQLLSLTDESLSVVSLPALDSATAITLAEFNALLLQLMQALPTSDPGSGLLWNNAGFLCVSETS